MIFKLQKIKTRRKFLKEGRGKKKILYSIHWTPLQKPWKQDKIWV